MTADELCFLSIRELGAKYRAREASPAEAVRIIFDRIDRFEKPLNSWISVRREEALTEARAAEKELRAGQDRGPLHGVPVSVKDNMDTAGLQTTCASRILRNRVPSRDATVVRRLRHAGAVLLGKTNLLEFAYGIVHPDYGQCNNPWDPSRTAGGSSSGAASSVAAGMGYAALGTDTGGSIRIPASYCGIVGYKPTYGLVSRAGVFPLSWSLDHVGPLTRTVEDTATVLQEIAGSDPDDPTAVNGPIPDPRKVIEGTLRGARVGVIKELMGDDLRPGVRAAFERALRVFRTGGTTVWEVSVPSILYSDQALLPVIGPEATAVHESWLRTRPEDYAPMTRAQLELGAMYAATDYVRAQRFRSKLMAECETALEQVEVLIAPTVAWVAPKEDPAVAGQEGVIEARRTAPFNLTGMPAITVPCGTAEDELPIGLQIAGRWLEDERVLQVAYAFERAAEWTVTVPRGVRS